MSDNEEDEMDNDDDYSYESDIEDNISIESINCNSDSINEKITYISEKDVISSIINDSISVSETLGIGITSTVELLYHNKFKINYNEYFEKYEETMTKHKLSSLG
jgi:hypothetical protein